MDNHSCTKSSDSLDWLWKKAKQAQENIDKAEAETPCQMFLPGFDIGALPNHLNRSSFIAPIARGKRKFHRQAIMLSRSDCVLEYTGEQLDEADGEIIMALIFFARSRPLGEPVPLNRLEILEKLERGTGKSDYAWLHRRLRALTESTLYIEAKKCDGSTRYRIGQSVAFHILAGFHCDGVEGYSYTLDPRWIQMFGNREYAFLDWNKRMQIGRGQDMAKTLQRLIATSSDPLQRYAVDWLKSKMLYSGRMRDFHVSLTRALKEMKRLDIISTWRIEESSRGKPQLAISPSRRDSVALRDRDSVALRDRDSVALRDRDSVALRDRDSVALDRDSVAL